jgi:hypothetical protein
MRVFGSIRLTCALAVAGALALSARAEIRTMKNISIEKLTKASDSVVVGRCVDKTVKALGGFVETEYTIRVDETLKGKSRKAGQEFTMTVPGGELTTPPITMSVAGMPHMVPDEDVVLFLKDAQAQPDTRIAERRNPKSLVGTGPMTVGLNEGKFTVITDRTDGIKKVARLNLENYGLAHQDRIYAKALGALASRQLRAQNSPAKDLGGPAPSAAPEPPKAPDHEAHGERQVLALSGDEAAAQISRQGGVSLIEIQDFKAQVRNSAN